MKRKMWRPCRMDRVHNKLGEDRRGDGLCAL